MIPLSPDQDDMPRWMPPEHCCFCGAKTRMWHLPKDVAVCVACAELRDESEVPTKDEWCNSPQAFGRSPYPGVAVLDRIRHGRRLMLRRHDDGLYYVYEGNDLGTAPPMDERAAIEWLAAIVVDLTGPLPEARDLYMKKRW